MPDASRNTSSGAGGNSNVLDFIETPLNACSLESFCHNIPGPAAGATSTSYLPLCLGCYQLNEETGTREGRLDLYAVAVRDQDNGGSKIIEGFGGSRNEDQSRSPLTILGGGEKGDELPPGVLDGKWYHRWARHGSYYATAHANGEIWVHAIGSAGDDGDNKPSLPRTNPFRAKLAGKSTSPSEREGLCLALAWENPPNGEDAAASESGPLESRIVSSYSDGHVAIHKVAQQGGSGGLELELEHHWDAHTMFGCPAEVWCANFIDLNTVVTGGDEGSWKAWDLRMPLTRPVHHGKDSFGAGVTVLSPHPRIHNLLTIGSYDETIAVFDLRKTSDNTAASRRPESLYHSDSLGGGIWRLKWHPFEDHKLLVAAMHGGCVVGEFDHLSAGVDGDSPAVEFDVQQKFTLHQSMAYGIDWLVHPGGSGGRGVETAASCSFYDKAMYLWKTNS